ncbi:MAG: DUF6776 family protein [Pseudomonadota bacterium]|nr:DUF6776 family protein [Pseudomonadota bacterium]
MIYLTGAHLRLVIAYLVGAILLVSGGYFLYEFGRFQGGYSLLDQMKERIEVEAVLVERDESIYELQRQLTLLEISKEIDRITYDEIEKTLNQLQVRVQSQDEELVFYREIISPQDGSAGLRIQNLEVSPVDSEQRYKLHMILIQAGVHDQSMAGALKFSIAGTQSGQTLDLSLKDLAVDGTTEDLVYTFRYFQELEQEVILPIGFEPYRIDVEISPQEPKGEQILQSFQWSAIAS